MSNLEKGIIASGFVAFVLSIAFSFQFYSSLSDSPVGQVSYISAGLLLSCLTVISITAAAYCMGNGAIITAVILLFAWVLLVGLELVAEVGFMGTQQEQKQASIAAKSAPLLALSKQIDSTQEQLADMDKGISESCSNPKFKTRCLQARNQKVAVQNRLSNLQGQQVELSKHSTMGSSTINPAFTWVSRVTGVDAQYLQSICAFLIGIFISLWASFAAFLLGRMRAIGQPNQQRLTVSDTTANIAHDTPYTAVNLQQKQEVAPLEFTPTRP